MTKHMPTFFILFSTEKDIFNPNIAATRVLGDHGPDQK